MFTDEKQKNVRQLNDESNDVLHSEQRQIRSKLIDVIGEQKPSILNFSSENLSISQSIMEQGFRKHSLLGWQIINRHTILNIFTIVLAISCIFFEIFKLPKVLENSKNIEMLKRDLEVLQRQLYDSGIDTWSGDNAEVNENNDYSIYDDDDDDDDDDDYESDLHDDIDVKQILRKTESLTASTTSLSVDQSGHDDFDKPRKRNEELNTNIKKNTTDLESVFLPSTSDHLPVILTDDTTEAPTKNFSNARSKRDSSNETFIGSFSRRNMVSINASRSSHSVQNENMNEYVKNDLNTAWEAGMRRFPRESHMIIDETRKVTVSKAPAKRNLRIPRQIFAAHYGADSSLFTDEDEYTGNGRFRHHEGIFKAWRPSDWMSDFEMDRYFSLNNDGKVTVHETGLYLIYAQIHYLDEHDENGFHILVNGRPILQCMVYSPGSGHKSRSCFSAQVTFLHNDDRIIVKDIGTSRYTLFQKDKSFFGLVRIGDMKHPSVHAPQLMETGG